MVESGIAVDEELRHRQVEESVDTHQASKVGSGMPGLWLVGGF